MPAEIDVQVARDALAAMGVPVDGRGADQQV